jgi:hypothetical protein
MLDGGALNFASSCQRGSYQTNQAGQFNNEYFSGKNYARFFVVNLELTMSILICCGWSSVMCAAHCYQRLNKTSDVLQPLENTIIFVEWAYNGSGWRRWQQGKRRFIFGLAIGL